MASVERGTKMVYVKKMVEKTILVEEVEQTRVPTFNISLTEDEASALLAILGRQTGLVQDFFDLYQNLLHEGVPIKFDTAFKNNTWNLFPARGEV